MRSLKAWLGFFISIIGRAEPGASAVYPVFMAHTQIAAAQLPRCFLDDIRFVVLTDVPRHGLDLRQDNRIVAFNLLRRRGTLILNRKFVQLPEFLG